VPGPHRQRDLAAAGQFQLREVVVDARDGVGRDAVAEDRMLGLGVQRLAVQRGGDTSPFLRQPDVFRCRRRAAMSGFSCLSLPTIHFTLR
jgi:hypothetical protein